MEAVKQEKMRQLGQELRKAETERLASVPGYTVSEVTCMMRRAIEERKNRK